uniref:N-acetyltransferase domain-containing protein n=1 Tax=Odontella aurita TaxID=265563 RepID=A0A7S4IVJ0_9STRA|mmetsp:Transcript_3103/g.8096  ORF Transcript_3103/g.8096 Transcript_3103/m.8096 type:complete len:182 (+) Transcript_3103:67-612(+)|eukprot:CAMPEP_0113550438 /NCGR_PEP_ID=MMETSP0015_2-20120614/13981_1 /TAXON_ID=2838 /ORGANISM="Odontella" /LENGTH=181 /DNA_ID=CAMNT_0000451243 /DNA_START=67 /DNA_END=612 /DNA_ORIENTATION=+ /assembly_acc=CAM_ASM_000160
MTGHKELDVEFGGITADNVGQLRLVNTSCFPVSYNDAFYKEVVKRRDEDLCKFAYWNGFVIGAICARIEPCPDSEGRSRLYIMTLGVLAAYRGREVGRKLVQSVLDFYEENKDKEDGGGAKQQQQQPMSTVDEVALHVQINNDDAMKFYIEGFGFEKGPMIENYYKRVDPPHCYLLSKKLR